MIDFPPFIAPPSYDGISFKAATLGHLQSGLLNSVAEGNVLRRIFDSVVQYKNQIRLGCIIDFILRDFFPIFIFGRKTGTTTYKKQINEVVESVESFNFRWRRTCGTN